MNKNIILIWARYKWAI